MNQDTSTLYTVGYTAFPSPEQLIGTLRRYGVHALIDVRSVPYSSHYGQYDKENLRRITGDAGIFYGNLAHAFGARQENRAFYKHGRLDFDTFSRSEQFRGGMRKIENGIQQGYAPVLLCAEKDPITCHRAILVARPFKDAGYRVVHILPDGGEKTQEDLERELLDLYFPDRDQVSLFSGESVSDEKAQLRAAYARQNDKIGFREENLLHDNLHNRFHTEDGGAFL